MTPPAPRHQPPARGRRGQACQEEVKPYPIGYFQLTLYVTRDMNRGAAAGVFDIASIEVAVDVIIGTLNEGLRRIIKGDQSRAYVEIMAIMMLRSVGMPSRKAQAATMRASNRLHHAASGNVSWWQPFA